MTYSNKQPDFTTQTATEYKAAIDNSIAFLGQSAGQFAVQPADPESMAVTVEGGVLPSGTVYNPTIVDQIGAPADGMKRRHWILYDPQSQTIKRLYWASEIPIDDDESTAQLPFMPATWPKLATFLLKGGDTKITADMIEDLRTALPQSWVDVKENETWVNFVDLGGSNRVKYSHYTGSIELFINTQGATPGFIVRDENGTELMKLDQDGNLHLKGTVNPTV